MRRDWCRRLLWRGYAQHSCGASVRFEYRNMLCRDFCLCQEEKIVAFLTPHYLWETHSLFVGKNFYEKCAILFFGGMKTNDIDWSKVPDILAKEQARLISHCSKRTALYYAQSRQKRERNRGR